MQEVYSAILLEFNLGISLYILLSYCSMSGFQAVCDAGSSAHSESDVNRIWLSWVYWAQQSKQQSVFWLYAVVGLMQE